MTPNQLPAYLLAAATVLAALPVTGHARENPGTHQHGHAELQAAVSGNQIDLIFTSPAYNLLGFEHQARSGEQKTRVTDTIAWLEATPLVNTPESGCNVQSADVHYGADDDDHHDDHDQEHHHGHDHNEEPEGHADIEVSQTLTCSGLDETKLLTTPLTTRFAEIEELAVQWVWSGRQGSSRLAQGDSSITLSAE